MENAKSIMSGSARLYFESEGAERVQGNTESQEKAHEEMRFDILSRYGLSIGLSHAAARSEISSGDDSREGTHLTKPEAEYYREVWSSSGVDLRL